jgi:hypothetical protein
VARLPCQPPAATHAVAPAAFHVRAEACPSPTVVGSALKVIVGTAERVTVICRDCVEEPPLPTQVIV